MPTTLSEGRHTAEYILSEAAGNRSRETVTLEASQKVEPGTVVGEVTASGKYHVFDEAAVDGTGVAAGVAYAAVDATADGTNADTEMVITARDTEVVGARLGWPDGISDNDKATAVGELEGVGIIVR